jgi:1-acyl-sn-glycerol-3-phosphate acyltransferase
MWHALLSLPVIGLGMLALGIPALIAALVDRSGDTTHRIVAAWARLCLFSVGVRVDCAGIENLPPGPVLLAANHSSGADIPILYAALPTSFRFVHKRSLFLLPIVGQILLFGGHIAIDRARVFRARRGLERAVRRVREGTSLLVFPEGTRSRDGRIGAFKRGSLKLAIEAGVPVVPVALCGVRRVIPRGALSLTPGEVRVRIQPPVPTRHRSPAEAEALAAEVEQQVRAGCEG